MPADQTLGQLDAVEIAPPQFKAVADAEVWSDKVDKLVEGAAPDIREMDRKRLKDLLLEFQDIFSQNDEDIGVCKILKHQLYTNDVPPVKQALRRQPAHYQKIIDEKVDALLRQNIIAPAVSAWGVNVVLAKKKDSSFRFCVDTRGLNKATVADAYPLPKIQQCLDSVSDASLFSTLDLTSYYFQLEIHPDDRHKTAFVTRGAFTSFWWFPWGTKIARPWPRRPWTLFFLVCHIVVALPFWMT